MGYEDLLLEKRDGIATITLNAPDKLNAFTEKMGKSLFSAVDEIARDDEMRVVIVTGAGRGFCSGADVTSMRARSAEATEVSLQAVHKISGWSYANVFPRLNKPVIAAINGPCAGGGFSLALSCDIRIASESASFVVAQVARGLIPDYGMTHFLPLAVGTSRALELMFTAGMVSAVEAERWGIVSQVVPPGELMKVAQELAARIKQQPPISVELTKRMVRRSLIDDLARQLDLETWAGRICSQTEDHQEGVCAFLEKRPPQFKGR